MEDQVRGRRRPGVSPLVAELGGFGSADLPLAGGKGANLGALIRGGFPVPPGFVITTRAYSEAAERLGLASEVRGIEEASAGAVDEPGSSGASGRIRRMLESAPLPNALVDSILAAYRGLGGGAVAVRSSATAEDLPGAAFAGQQETFLNVIGEPSLLKAVRGCWASLWSERAISYRQRQRLDQGSITMAVVVQKMAAAEAAGVMFTADPVTGSRESILLDANPGLGEAVVAGLVTPDRFVIRRRGLRVTEHRPGRREVVIRPKEGGGTERSRERGGAEAALSRGAARSLAALGLRIERRFGAPQDIEWAWERNGRGPGRPLILQARPMTALPEPLQMSAAMRMLAPMLVEMWPVRPYPLDVTTFTGAIEEAIGRLLSALLGKAAPDPRAALVEEDGVVLRVVPPAPRPSPSIIFTLLRTLRRTRRFDPSSWSSDPLIQEVLGAARQLRDRNLPALSWSENLQTLQEALGLVSQVMLLRDRYVPRALLRLGGLWLRLTLAGKRDRLGALLAGMEHKTAETNRKLEELAGEIRRDEVLRSLFEHVPVSSAAKVMEETTQGRALLRRLDAFLSEYGHREIGLAISQGTWGDHPEAVLGILKALAGSPERRDAPAAAWKTVRDEVLRSSFLGRFPFRAGFLRALAGARSLFEIREDTHFYATLAMPIARNVAMELGRRLNAGGVLSVPEEVFHLRLEELQAIGEAAILLEEPRSRLRTLVDRRRAKRLSLGDSPLFDPRLLEGARRRSLEDGVLLAGSPGSPGVTHGPARVIHSEAEFGSFRDGDVLVAPYTNPAWTPLFTRAAAVVVDRGGASSHAAIVAREYGVPAVMGTVDGTLKLVSGQVVRVDGTRGLVLEEDRS
jgi:rifampicin phosphotransferase